MSGPAETCPGGSIRAHMGFLWAHMGSYGAHMGPPGQVLASPDMSDFRLLVELCMSWFHNLLFDEISRLFCMAFAGEAEKTCFFD